VFSVQVQEGYRCEPRGQAVQAKPALYQEKILQDKGTTTCVKTYMFLNTIYDIGTFIFPKAVVLLSRGQITVPVSNLLFKVI